MINGTAIKQNANGGLPFTFRMPVSNVSRIEVIRGLDSAIDGAYAFSGADQYPHKYCGRKFDRGGWHPAWYAQQHQYMGM